MELPKKDILIVLETGMQKNGKDNNGWEKVTGRFGYGDQNERGERLLELALEQDKVTCSKTYVTYFTLKTTTLRPRP